MLTLDRRALLRGASLLPLAYLFTGAGPNGCAGFSPAIVPQWVGIINAVGDQVVLDEPQLVMAGLSPNVGQQVLDYDKKIENLAATVGATSTAVQGKPVLIQMEAYFNAIAPIAEPILVAAATAAIGPAGGFAVSIAIAALPVVEFAINAGVSQLTAQAKALAAHAQVPAPSVAHRQMASRHRMGAMAPGVQLPTAFNYAAADELLRRAGIVVQP